MVDSKVWLCGHSSSGYTIWSLIESMPSAHNDIVHCVKSTVLYVILYLMQYIKGSFFLKSYYQNEMCFSRFLVCLVL